MGREKNTSIATDMTPRVKPCHSYPGRRIKLLAIGAFLLLLGGVPFASTAQSDTVPGTAEIIHAKPDFISLWSRQSTLWLGLLGSRQVSETDIFSVRWYNPNGLDFITEESYNLVTRQHFYSVLTAGYSFHRIYPLVKSNFLTMHAEVSAEILYQKLFVPSMAVNSVSSGEHYRVDYCNLPDVGNAEVLAGLWIAERVSVGAGFFVNRYSVHTADDRTVQRNYTIMKPGWLPYARVWIPLEKTPMKRWSARAGVYAYGLENSDASFRALKTELSLFRVSKQYSGRTFGIFFRSLHYFSIPSPEGDFHGYSLHSDEQYLLGISFGTGGLNLNKGR